MLTIIKDGAPLEGRQGYTVEPVVRFNNLAAQVQAMEAIGQLMPFKRDHDTLQSAAVEAHAAMQLTHSEWKITEVRFQGMQP